MARRRRPKGPSAELRLYALGFFMLCMLGVIVARLWWEQVARGNAWKDKIASRSEVTVRIPSVRGEIRDRNGVTLVGNRASYEVDFYLPDMVRGYRQQNEGKVPIKTYTGTVRSRSNATSVVVSGTSTSVFAFRFSCISRRKVVAGMNRSLNRGGTSGNTTAWRSARASGPRA